MVLRFIFVNEVCGECSCAICLENVGALAEVEGVGRCHAAAACCGWSCLLWYWPRRWVSADCIEFIDCVHFDFSQSIVVSREMMEVVPSHRIDICLCNFAGKDGMVSRKISVEVFEPHQTLLLDYLRVNVGRAERLDLGDQKIPNALDGLIAVSLAI